MSELVIIPPLLILGAGGVAAFMLWRAGTLAPDVVNAWTRIGRHHGLVDPRSLGERLSDQVPFLKALYKEADVPRLLLIGGRTETVTAWGLRTIGLSLALTAFFLVLDFLIALVDPTSAYPPALALLAGVAWVLIGYVRLRRAARLRQESLELALSDSLAELAMLTFAGQMSVETALGMVAISQRDRTLYDLFKNDSWKQLVEASQPQHTGLGATGLVTTPSIYEGIGRAYGVPMFGLLASAVRRMQDKGLPPRQVLTNLARTVGNAKVAEMVVRSERARIRLAVPIGMVVLPLLALIGWPVIATTAGTIR